MTDTQLAILAISPLVSLVIGGALGIGAGWLAALSMPYGVKQMFAFGIFIAFGITRFTGPYGGGPITGWHAFFCCAGLALLLQARRTEFD